MCGAQYEVSLSKHYLAFDLGAESGRAILGKVSSGVLDVSQIRRFPNEPVRAGNSLHWDVQRLWLEMQRALSEPMPELDSIGIDTWGVDYALIGETGELLENPYHYRDCRTDGILDAVLEKVPRERIYSITGVQFMQINTLYQLYAACQATPRLIDAAEAMVTIPDLLNYWLTGTLRSEYTNATTTQLIDARTRSWSTELIAELGLPRRLFQSLVEPGAEVGKARGSGTPVIAPACHDTGSAVASISMSRESVFLSSGTWSLLGTELTEPVITTKARELNFTNEGGVCGTVRVLKNIAGLWLLQSCRRCWKQDVPYDDLLTAASDPRYEFQSLFDPDDAAFLHPENMVTAIAEYCRKTEQPAPTDPPGCTRAILESLALKYRAVLESLEEIAGIQFREIRVVGGGARNRMLNQFTADATGRPVVAGPVEATALGNIAMQMLATGAVGSLHEARAVIDRSFPSERFEPFSADRWESPYRRFQQYVKPRNEPREKEL
jgi:rhamnulokinase